MANFLSLSTVQQSPLHIVKWLVLLRAGLINDRHHRLLSISNISNTSTPDQEKEKEKPVAETKKSTPGESTGEDSLTAEKNLGFVTEELQALLPRRPAGRPASKQSTMRSTNEPTRGRKRSTVPQKRPRSKSDTCHDENASPLKRQCRRTAKGAANGEGTKVALAAKLAFE